MRVEWYGGPLDGLADEIPQPPSHWVGPDPILPQTHAVVYLLETSRDRPARMVFRMDITNHVNERANLELLREKERKEKT